MKLNESELRRITNQNNKFNVRGKIQIKIKI